MSQENVETVRRAFDALSRGDFEAFVVLHDATAEIHELAEMPDHEIYRGHDEIRRWAEAGSQIFPRVQWTLEEVLHDADGRVVVRTGFRGQGGGSGAPVDQTVFHLIEFDDAGLVVRARAWFDRDQAVRAVGLPE
jgi:ketosteroid isomerase-like protein